MKMENQFWALEIDIDNWNKKLYYDSNKKKWVTRKEYTDIWYPGRFPCHSYRAAVRHLRKHDEIPVGTKFRLVSKYIGFDRWLTKK